MGKAPDGMNYQGTRYQGMKYPRKKGYTKRYLHSEFRKNRLSFLLSGVFLLGVLGGCSIAGEAGSAVLGTLERFFASDAGVSSGDFLGRMLSVFASNVFLLLLLLLCGMGAIFQPIVLLLVFLRGVGLGVMGVYSYSAGQAVWYLLVMLPEAILSSFLLIAAAGESLRFSVRFFVQLLPESAQEGIPEPKGGMGRYFLHFLVFYLLGGTIALLSAVTEVIFGVLR